MHQAKKARVAAAKLARTAANKGSKRPAENGPSDGDAGAASPPPLSKKARKKAAKKEETPKGSRAQPSGVKAAKAARLDEQNKRQHSNVLETRAKRLADMKGLVFEPPYEVFLKYLPHDVSTEQVVKHFEGCGEMVFPGPRVRNTPTYSCTIR